MGLIFDVLSSINNPNTQGSVSSLASVVSAVSQVAGSQGLDASKTEGMMSILGGVARSALQQQSRTVGGSQLEGMLGQLAGAAGGGGGGGLLGQLAGAAAGAGGAGALQSLFPPALQQQVATAISTKLGLPSGVVQAAMPALLSTLTGLLNMGAPAPGSGGGNPVLKAFLDSDNDQDVDLGDVMKFAGRFLNAPGV